MAWDEREHPRDPRTGEFVDKGADWAATLLSRLIPTRQASVGSKAQVDAEIAAGGVQLWRGAHPTANRKLLAGEPYWGDGLYGSGIYATVSTDDADYYATNGWMLDEPPDGSGHETTDIQSALALDAGYDAVRIVGGHTGAVDDFGDDSDADQYVILNPAALLLERP